MIQPKQTPYEVKLETKNTSTNYSKPSMSFALLHLQLEEVHLELGLLQLQLLVLQLPLKSCVHRARGGRRGRVRELRGGRSVRRLSGVRRVRSPARGGYDGSTGCLLAFGGAFCIISAGGDFVFMAIGGGGFSGWAGGGLLLAPRLAGGAFLGRGIGGLVLRLRLLLVWGFGGNLADQGRHGRGGSGLLPWRVVRGGSFQRLCSGLGSGGGFGDVRGWSLGRTV